MPKTYYISLVEQMVMCWPEGFEGWRMFRIEYHPQELESFMWLPPGVDPSVVEDVMNGNETCIGSAQTVGKP